MLTKFRATSTDKRKSSSSKKKVPTEEVAEESRSSQVTVAADMVFSTSKNLSGVCIIAIIELFQLIVLN